MRHEVVLQVVDTRAGIRVQKCWAPTVLIPLYLESILLGVTSSWLNHALLFAARAARHWTEFCVIDKPPQRKSPFQPRVMVRGLVCLRTNERSEEIWKRNREMSKKCEDLLAFLDSLEGQAKPWRRSNGRRRSR